MRVRFWTHTKNNPPKTNKQTKNLSPSPTRPKNAYLDLAPPYRALVWGLPLHKDLGPSGPKALGRQDRVLVVASTAL